MNAALCPPGPKFSLPHLLKLHASPAPALASLAQRYGDIVHIRLGGQPVIFFNHPSLIEIIDLSGPFFRPAQIPNWVHAPTHYSLSETVRHALRLVAHQPNVADRLLDEITQAQKLFGGVLPQPQHMPFARKVIAETLRMHPPALIDAVKTVEGYTLGGYRIPVGSTILVSPWVIHHDSRFYSDPFLFQPQRWDMQFPSARLRSTYFPYGLGLRAETDEDKAYTEGVALLISQLAGERRE